MAEVIIAIGALFTYYGIVGIIRAYTWQERVWKLAQIALIWIVLLPMITFLSMSIY